MSENNTGFSIIRCDRAGVFFAKVHKLEGSTAVLTDCRRLWYWSGAASLSQMAMEGVKRPNDCRFTATDSGPVIPGSNPGSSTEKPHSNGAAFSISVRLFLFRSSAFI